MRSSAERGRSAAVAAAVLACVGAAGASPPPRTPQGGVFSSGVATVRLDVSVRQNGRAVSGLTASDFEVLDEGVRQQVELIGLDRAPASVVLVLDMSGSVRGPRLDQLRRAARGLIDLLQNDDRGALLTFTERVSLPTAFTQDPRALAAALDRPVAGRDTALVDAVHASLVLADSARGRPLVIVFSDGADTASFLTPALVLDTAKRAGAVVNAVTSSQAEPGGFLDDVTRLTGGRRLDVSSLDRLSDTFAEILQEARERYLLSYTPAGVRAGGWHTLAVRVRGRRAEIRARPGYLAR